MSPCELGVVNTIIYYDIKLSDGLIQGYAALFGKVHALCEVVACLNYHLIVVNMQQLNYTSCSENGSC